MLCPADQCKMGFSAATKILYDRIQFIEPDLVSKIIGYILVHADGEKEILQFAFGPDQLIHALVAKAKLHLLSSKSIFPLLNPLTALKSGLPTHPFTPTTVSSQPGALRVPSSYWDPSVMDQPLHNMDLVSDDYHNFNHPHFLRKGDHFESVNPAGLDFANYDFYPDATLARSNRRYSTFSEFPLKPCHYWNRGHCKNGSNCRYLHSHGVPDSFSQIISPTSNDLINDDHFLPGSLEQLELELTDLLKSIRGFPVSIASLPLLYQEKYGKTLQAEGYLTESQRHGKAGYSLTKLLARLKNSIRLIDRPHGQHAVVLAEDVPRYMEYRSERSDPGGVVAGSRQIYLTFPAESTFTEEDVSNYFSNFGPVQDVRIPSQQKRMFGFVTFLYPETVKMILAKGNPHFVCGARVLVKPYREKARIVDRKYMEKSETSLFYPSHFLDMDAELQLVPRDFDSSRLLRKQFMVDHEQALDLEAQRLSELQLAPRQLSRPPYLGYSLDDFKDSEGCRDHPDVPSTDSFSYLLDVINNESFNDEKGMHSSNNDYTDQGSNQGLNLPESPFASPVKSSIST